MQDFLDEKEPTYTLRGLILSFLLGAATAVLLWFLIFRK
jgi:hypothetical protein